jgi:hypothetical protein
MKLYINVKPQRVIIPSPSIWGINCNRQLAGINAIFKVAPKAFHTIGCSGDTKWSASTDINDNIYVYNVEYHKRGKYKNNKEYLIHVYKFNVELLKTLGLSIEQNHYNFKLYKTDNYGKKIYL